MGGFDFWLRCGRCQLFCCVQTAARRLFDPGFDNRPFLKWKIRGMDDEHFDGSELRREFRETPLVARLHRLMNETGRREEGDHEAALTGRESERETFVARFAAPP